MLYQLNELHQRINLVNQKISQYQNLQKDIRKLEKLKNLLCDAHFYYWNSYCEHLDTF